MSENLPNPAWARGWRIAAKTHAEILEEIRRELKKMEVNIAVLKHMIALHEETEKRRLTSR